MHDSASARGHWGSSKKRGGRTRAKKRTPMDGVGDMKTNVDNKTNRNKQTHRLRPTATPEAVTGQMVGRMSRTTT